MRVVHIFKDYYPPTTGGIEQHINLLCREQVKRGLHVSALVPSRSRRTYREQIEGVHVVRVAEFGRYASAPLCPTAAMHLRRLKPDIVHVHFPNPMGDLTYLLSGWRGPLVVTYHADIVKQRRLLQFYRPVVGMLFARAHRIIATSNDYAASSDWLRHYRAKCEIVPLAIDAERFTSDEETRAGSRDIRARFGERLLVFVGVLRYYKGIDVLLDAMKLVNGHVLIVGRGAERSRLEARAAALGVEEKATFLGEVNDACLRAILHAADVFVLPSIDRCEAFGLSMLEAMACGKPVVSSDLPTGVRFVNQHEVTGLLVPPSDPDALAGALNRLLDDPGLRLRLGQAGRTRVTGELHLDRMVERTLAVYDEALRAAQSS